MDTLLFSLLGAFLQCFGDLFSFSINLNVYKSSERSHVYYKLLDICKCSRVKQ